MNQPIQRTELQQLVEDQRIAQNRLSAMLQIALNRTETEEDEAVIVAAIKFAETDYDIWQRIEALVREQAEKGGAV